MKHFPVFSVVIPTYNRAALIVKTLETVWQQTYPHYEIIVVDNCSTDDTLEVLDPFIQTKRIKLIRHDSNRERAHSRNTGMAAARGDFVTLLDSDDLMYATNLEDAARFIEAHPDYKCFQNLFEFVDAREKVVYRPRFPDLRNQLKAIARGNFMSCIGDFIHRDIYTRYRFNTDPEIIGGEDWDFWLRVLADHKVGRIEKINNGVVQHEGRSVNHQDILGLGKGLEKIRDSIVADAHLGRTYAPYIKCIEASSLIYLALLANGCGSYRLALNNLYEAAKKDPTVLMTPRFVRASQIAIKGSIKGQDKVPEPVQPASQRQRP